MNIEEFNKKDILGDFEYELNKLCRSCIGTATEIKIKQQPLIHLFEKIVWFYEKEKETSHYIQSQLDIANAKLVEEKEKNKELERGNRELNIIRLECLVSQFPDTTETYKKYKKELDEAISNLKEE